MRILAQLVGVLLLVGFVGAYFWWILAAAAVAVSWAFWRLWPRFIDWTEAVAVERAAADGALDLETGYGYLLSKLGADPLYESPDFRGWLAWKAATRLMR